MSSFPSRLRSARGALLFTQDQVARVLRVSPKTIANWENGRAEPNVAALAQLAQLLRVSLDWLVTGVHRLPHSFATPVEVCKHLVPLHERCLSCEGRAS